MISEVRVGSFTTTNLSHAYEFEYSNPFQNINGSFLVSSQNAKQQIKDAFEGYHDIEVGRIISDGLYKSVYKSDEGYVNIHDALSSNNKNDALKSAAKATGLPLKSFEEKYLNLIQKHKLMEELSSIQSMGRLNELKIEYKDTFQDMLLQQHPLMTLINNGDIDAIVEMALDEKELIENVAANDNFINQVKLLAANQKVVFGSLAFGRTKDVVNPQSYKVDVSLTPEQVNQALANLKVNNPSATENDVYTLFHNTVKEWAATGSKGKLKGLAGQRPYIISDVQLPGQSVTATHPHIHVEVGSLWYRTDKLYGIPIYEYTNETVFKGVERQVLANSIRESLGVTLTETTAYQQYQTVPQQTVAPKKEEQIEEQKQGEIMKPLNGIQAAALNNGIDINKKSMRDLQLEYQNLDTSTAQDVLVRAVAKAEQEQREALERAEAAKKELQTLQFTERLKQDVVRVAEMEQAYIEAQPVVEASQSLFNQLSSFVNEEALNNVIADMYPEAEDITPAQRLAAIGNVLESDYIDSNKLKDAVNAAITEFYFDESLSGLSNDAMDIITTYQEKPLAESLAYIIQLHKERSELSEKRAEEFERQFESQANRIVELSGELEKAKEDNANLIDDHATEIDDLQQEFNRNLIEAVAETQTKADEERQADFKRIQAVGLSFPDDMGKPILHAQNVEGLVKAFSQVGQEFDNITQQLEQANNELTASRREVIRERTQAAEARLELQEVLEITGAPDATTAVIHIEGYKKKAASYSAVVAESVELKEQIEALKAQMALLQKRADAFETIVGKESALDFDKATPEQQAKLAGDAQGFLEKGVETQVKQTPTEQDISEMLPNKPLTRQQMLDQYKGPEPDDDNGPKR